MLGLSHKAAAGPLCSGWLGSWLFSDPRSSDDEDEGGKITKTHTCSLRIRWQGHKCALSVQRTFLTFPCPEGRALCWVIGPEIEALTASSSCGAFCEWLDTSQCSHQVGRACTVVSRSLVRSPVGGRLERSKRSCEAVKKEKKMYLTFVYMNSYLTNCLWG